MAYDKTKIEWLTPASSGLVYNAPVVTLSASDKTKIEGYLDSLYTTSLGSDLLDRATAGAAMLKIGGAATGDVGYAYKGGVGAGYIAINVSDIDKVYVINEVGVLVKCDPRLSLIHELGHAIDIRSDPTSFTDADLQGTAVAFQNAVAEELGLSAQKQVSYSGQVLDTDGRFADLNTSTSWTNGQTIKNALLGRNSVNDVVDLSGRAAESDLVFGFNGNDLIKTGGGNDFVYGGGGNDTLDGGEGEDSLSGGDGDDNLFGGGGADTLVGGQGDDKLYVNGADHLDGGGDNDLVTVVDGGTLEIVIGGTAPGIASATNVETFEGKALADTFHIAGAGTAVFDGGSSPSAGDWEAALYAGDKLTFDLSPQGVEISIGMDGIVTALGHEVRDVELLIGSNHADTITASAWGGSDWNELTEQMTPHGVWAVQGAGGNDVIDVSAAGSADLIYGANDGEDTILGRGEAYVTLWFKDIPASQLTITYVATGATEEEWIDLNPDYWYRSTPVDFYIGVAGGNTKILLGDGSVSEDWQDPGVEKYYRSEFIGVANVEWTDLGFVN